MKGIPHRNKFEPTGGNARKLESHANRGGSAGSKQHAVQIAGRNFAEASGQLNRGRACIAAGAKAEFIKLLFDRCNNTRMCKADLMDVVTVEVEITSALDILNPRPLCLGQHVEARRGKGLMQEMATVSFQQRLRLGSDMFGRPRSSLRGKIDIALGAEVIEVVARGRIQ